MKKTWLIGVIAVLSGLAVGGYFYWKGISWQSPFPKTKEGIIFEEFLPEDAFFVFSFNPSDSAERGRSQKLWGTILQDKKDALPILIATELAVKKFPGAQTEDFLKLLNASSAFTLALAGEGFPKPPTFYFLLAIDNQDKEAILNMATRLQTNATGVRVDLLGDVLMVTNAEENLIVQKTSFADSPVFKKSFRNSKGPLSGYTFMTSKFFGLPATTGITAVSIHAKDDGFLFETAVETDKENLAYPALLYQIVPGASVERKPLFYIESQGLGDILLQAFHALVSTTQEFSKNFKQITGFDFETEVKPVLDNGYALALHDTESLLPAFSFFINAEATAKKALNIVKALQEHDQSWIILGNLALQAEKDSPVIEDRQRFKNIFYAGTIRIHLDRIPKEIAAIPLFEKLTEPLEISYGMTNTNFLFFSTLPNFEEALEDGKTIEESTNIFQQGRTVLNMEPGSIAYFNFDALGDYVERVAVFAKKEEKLSPEQERVYEFLKQYLAPIKEFLQVSQGDGKTVRAKSFLKIAP